MTWIKKNRYLIPLLLFVIILAGVIIYQVYAMPVMIPTIDRATFLDLPPIP